MDTFDVLIIGAGPGGYVCAVRAAQLGLKTAIVEKQWMGGVCLNVGCIPSKALLRNAEVARLLREDAKEFGVSFEKLNIDFTAAVKRSRKVAERLVRGVSFLMKKNGVTVFNGKAKFNTASSLIVTGEDGKTQEISAKNIVIATGSHVLVPPTWKIDGQKVVTYLEAILQEKLPQSVIIIGAGAIGVEFATVWNSYGSQVTLVEMLPQILPLEDEEISAEVTKAFNKRGITPLTNHKVEEIKTTAEGVSVSVSHNGETKTLQAEQALVAIGFQPNTTDLDLEKVGVQLDQKGFVVVDERMATNVPGVWAIGDVTGKLLLAHVGFTMGKKCAEAISGEEVAPIQYQMVPRATFCHPQVASFGMTEAQAKQAGYEVKVGKFPFQGIGKAIALDDYAGFAKIITDAKYGEILGAHFVGPEVSELLPELTLAHSMELTANEVAENIHIHPTLSEILMEAAEAVDGRAIHI